MNSSRDRDDDDSRDMPPAKSQGLGLESLDPSATPGTGLGMSLSCQQTPSTHPPNHPPTTQPIHLFPTYPTHLFLSTHPPTQPFSAAARPGTRKKWGMWGSSCVGFSRPIWIIQLARMRIRSWGEWVGGWVGVLGVYVVLCTNGIHRMRTEPCISFFLLPSSHPPTHPRPFPPSSSI